MQYPDGRVYSAPSSWKEVTYGNRGMDLEHEINLSNQYYLDKSFSRKSISTILNALVLSNIKKVNKENVVHLKIYKEFILEIIASLNEFYIVLQTFDEYEINYAKLYFSDKEYMFSHVFKDGKHLLISQKIKYREMIDFSSIDYRLIVNGKEDFTEI